MIWNEKLYDFCSKSLYAMDMKFASKNAWGFGKKQKINTYVEMSGLSQGKA